MRQEALETRALRLMKYAKHSHRMKLRESRAKGCKISPLSKSHLSQYFSQSAENQRTQPYLDVKRYEMKHKIELYDNERMHISHNHYTQPNPEHSATETFSVSLDEGQGPQNTR